MPEFNGVEVTEEQLAAIEKHNAGLVGNRDAILAEKKEVEDALKAQQEDLQAKQDALVKAEEDKLKLAGDTEALKAFYEEKNAKTLAEANKAADELRNTLLGRDTELIKASILGNVEPEFKEMAEAMLNQSMSVSYNETGELVKEFKIGDGVVNSESDFLSRAAESSDSWKRMLTGAKSTGTGAQTQPYTGATSTANFSGSKQEKTAAAVKANPALKELPIK